MIETMKSDLVTQFHRAQHQPSSSIDHPIPPSTNYTDTRPMTGNQQSKHSFQGKINRKNSALI